MADGHLEALRDAIDADHDLGSVLACDPGGHLADRPQPIDSDAATLRDGRVLDRLPGGGEDVGEEQEVLVRLAVLGHLDRPEMSLGNAQELRLSARNLAVELRVAE